MEPRATGQPRASQAGARSHRQSRASDAARTAPDTARALSAPCRPRLHLRVSSVVAGAPESGGGPSLPFRSLSGEAG